MAPDGKFGPLRRSQWYCRSSMQILPGERYPGKPDLSIPSGVLVDVKLLSLAEEVVLDKGDRSPNHALLDTTDNAKVQSVGQAHSCVPKNLSLTQVRGLYETQQQRKRTHGKVSQMEWSGMERLTFKGNYLTDH